MRAARISRKPDPDDSMPDTPQDNAAKAAKVETAAPAFRSGALSHRKPTRFAWEAGPEARAALARSLDLPRISRLSLAGEIRPEGRADFRLEARLLAQVTQSCVVTLAPVPATIDETVTRQFLADFAAPEGDEVELPEDDSTEPLPERIDIAEIAREALALALPLYPRAPGAELGEAVFAAPGVDPLRDEDLRPFAALSRLVPGRDDTPE
jgi:uncharacterized metal-binding protein YceD (DUF177 family)